ncbi:sensor histidine kinase, partial [Roseateles saccharophilus]
PAYLVCAPSRDDRGSVLTNAPNVPGTSSPGKPQTATVITIRKGAEHLNELLTEILDFSKIEAGAMVLHEEVVDPVALVRGTADFFALTAQEKGLALRVSIPADCPRRWIGDSLRLKQILNNLLSNALKFTSQGHVELRLECRPGSLVFHVEDTGPGVAEELQGVIFEKFRQADGSVSHQHGGTGLGLALSRGLAELMQGRLDLQSTPGVGSRFSLTLPLAPVQA